MLAAICTAVLAASCDAPACGASEPSTKGTITIASLLPVDQSGPVGGQSAQRAVQYAMDTHRFLKGYRLRYWSLNDDLAGSPDITKSRQNMQQIAADPSVLGVVGPFNSPLAFADIPVANAASLAMVSPSTTDDCLTIPIGSCQPPPRPAGPNNFFRVATRDSLQGTAMADFAYTRLGLRKIAVLEERIPFEAFAWIADSFQARFGQLGGTVTMREKFAPYTDDFIPLLHRVRQSGAEAIYGVGTGDVQTCRMRAQMGALFPTGTFFLGIDSMADEHCINDAGAAGNDTVAATVALPATRNDTQAAAVVANFKMKYPNEMGSYTFAAYDSTLILIDAIGRAIDMAGGTLPTRREVVSAVGETRDLKGVTGIWSFNAYGDPTAPGMSVYRIHGGKWTFWESVSVVSAGT